MPTQSKKLIELREASPEGELPYMSKSRVTTYISCPRKFFHRYIEGRQPPTNYHMRKGSRIHRIFEEYYENAVSHHTNRFMDNLPETIDDLVGFLPDDTHLWLDWMKPYIGNFIAWELERAQQAATTRDWLPVSVEEEIWKSDEPIPWMGITDVIVPARSIPEIQATDGVVIIDFKTGKTPDEQYRETGIFLECEYYAMLCDGKLNVQGAAGYFPKENELIVTPLSDDRREFIQEQVGKIKTSGTNKEAFEPNTSPLCRYGPANEEECPFYSRCEAGQGWGAPADRWEEFIVDIENGLPPSVLRDKYSEDDQSSESIYYWIHKVQQ